LIIAVIHPTQAVAKLKPQKIQAYFNLAIIVTTCQGMVRLKNLQGQGI